MYSEKLEEVISAALADGNLTEQKRKIIMRRAEREGEDADEVMMVVEARLHNLNKGQTEQTPAISEAKKNEIADGDFIEIVICDTVVTQELWKAVMGHNFPSLIFIGDKLPVNNLTWEESYQFINKLSALTNKNYHLPSEAQWEYAAIGGRKSLGFIHAGSDNIKNVGWTGVNEMKPVAQLSPNELGLYDMSGNCYEFCEDNLVEDPVLNGTKNPIVRTKPTDFRILRSTPFDGSEFSIGDCFFTPINLRKTNYGFRIAL